MEKTMDVYHQILTLPLFKAEDDYEVEVFIKEVEEKSLRYMWTARQQFLIAKKRLGGTAALWLRSEDPFSDWKELKYAMRREFSNGEFSEDNFPEIHKDGDIYEFLTHDGDAQPFAQEVSTAIEVALSVEQKKEENAELTLDITCQNENKEIYSKQQEHQKTEDAANNGKSSITLNTAEDMHDVLPYKHTHVCDVKRSMWNHTSRLQRFSRVEYYNNSDLGKTSHHDDDSFGRTTSDDATRFHQGAHIKEEAECVDAICMKEECLCRDSVRLHSDGETNLSNNCIVKANLWKDNVDSQRLASLYTDHIVKDEHTSDRASLSIKNKMATDLYSNIVKETSMENSIGSCSEHEFTGLYTDYIIKHSSKDSLSSCSDSKTILHSNHIFKEHNLRSCSVNEMAALYSDHKVKQHLSDRATSCSESEKETGLYSHIVKASSRKNSTGSCSEHEFASLYSDRRRKYSEGLNCVSETDGLYSDHIAKHNVRSCSENEMAGHTDNIVKKERSRKYSDSLNCVSETDGLYSEHMAKHNVRSCSENETAGQTDNIVKKSLSKKYSEGSKTQSETDSQCSNHLVKDEVVIGPEIMQRPSLDFVVQGAFARGGQLALRECSAARVPPRATPRPALDTRTTYADSDVDEETLAFDYEKEPICNLCGKRFTLKSDLVKHAMIHIYTPTSTLEGEGRHAVSGYGASARRGQLALWECSVRLERVPPRAALRTDQETRTTYPDSDAEEEILAFDNDKEPICDICGRRFTLKSDLVKHAMIHIYTPTSTLEGEGRHAVSGYDSAVVSGRGARLLSRECWVRLERVAPPRRESAATTRAHAAPPRGGDGDYQHAATNTYQCDACGKTYQQKYSLVRHINIYGHLNKNKHILMAEKPHFCEICRKRFTLLGHLKAHKRIHLEKKPFSCDTCQKQFTRADSLKQHILVHTGEKSYSCEICKKKFSQASNLNTHKVIHREERPHSCEICKKQFKLLCTLKRHKQVHTGENNYSCKICLKTFSRSSNLKLHMLVHTGIKPHECEVCKKQFRQLIHLLNHKRTHTGERPYSCKVCKKRFADSSYLNKHIKFHAGVRPYFCEICQKWFKDSSALKTHKRIHTKEKPYSCEICKKKFTRSGHLNLHKLSHSGEKAYSCEICNNMFTQLSNLKTHQRVHTEIRAYSCEICFKRFKEPYTLKSHKLLHTGHKPYACDICKEEFTLLDNLKEHKLVHAVAKPFSCQICKKQFSRSDILHKHKQIHTNLKPYSCNVCKKQFRRSDSLTEHKKIHSGLKPYSCEICNKRFKRSQELNRHKHTHTRDKLAVLTRIV